MRWPDLLERGAVEFIDTEEEETVMICMTPEDLQESRNALNGQTTAGNSISDFSVRLKSISVSKHWTHCEIHPRYVFV